MEGIASSSTVHVPRRRKVPDAIRQRIEFSCDRCKTRKRRCIRKSETRPCDACEGAGVACKTSLPRKRRAQTTDSTTQIALLKSIIHKQYPHEELDSLEALRSLTQRIGVEGEYSMAGDASASGKHDSEAGDSDSDPEPTEPNEGWLVPAPKGGSHYIGPASAVHFARCVRALVSKSQILEQPSFDEKGLRRYMQAAAFITYKVSHTVEANLQDQSSVLLTANTPISTVDPYLDRTLSDQLVTAYFSRVQLNIPVLHEGAFRLRYNERWGKSDITSEPGWICTLLMVYILGAQVLEDEVPIAGQIQQHFLFTIIREGLGRLVLTSTLDNVKALVLLSLYQHNAGERNTAWILAGQAIRSGVAIGLHRNGDNGNFDPFESNSRRMVWWQLHLFEQYVSLALGRPSYSDKIRVSAVLPDTSYESGLGLPPSYLENHITLCRFVARIKKALGSMATLYGDVDRLLEWQPIVVSIVTGLRKWRQDLPASLAWENPLPEHRRQILLLHIWADYLEANICRVFVLCRVHLELGSLEVPSQINDLANLSVHAAVDSARKLLLLATHNLLEGMVWLDYYAALSAIIITAVNRLARPQSQQDAAETVVAQMIPVIENTRMAMTYRITMNVALQLACLVELTPVPVPPTDPSTQSFIPSNITPQSGAPSQFDQLFGTLQGDMTIPDLDGEMNYGAGLDSSWNLFDIDSLGNDHMPMLESSHDAVAMDDLLREMSRAS